MRRLLAACLALSLAGPAHAAAPGPIAGYRDDGALDCDQLRLEILAVRAEAERLAVRARSVEVAEADVSRPVFVAGLQSHLAASRPAQSPAWASAREARRKGAQRRLEAAQARHALLAGLHQVRGCRIDRQRPAPLGPADTALGAAD